jgi:hypothetical protein
MVRSASWRLLLTGGASAILLSVVTIPLLAQSSSPPNFSPSSNVGWRAYGDDFILPLSGPGPVTFDPQHPFVQDCVVLIGNPARNCSNKPSTFRIADLRRGWTNIRKRCASGVRRSSTPSAP